MTEERKEQEQVISPDKNFLRIGRIYVEFDKFITPKEIQMLHLTLIAYLHAESVVDEGGGTHFGRHNLNNPMDQNSHYG